jgi:hypothetical protein
MSRLVFIYSSPVSTRARVTIGGCGMGSVPRVKDLKDRKLYTVDKPGAYPLLEPLIGDTVETPNARRKQHRA